MAARKRYVSLYPTALRVDRYLLAAYADRLPSAKVLCSCVNVTKPDLLDDAVLAAISRETVDVFADRLPHPPRRPADQPDPMRGSAPRPHTCGHPPSGTQVP